MHISKLNLPDAYASIIDVTVGTKSIYIIAGSNVADFYVYLRGGGAKHLSFEEFYNILYEAINKTEIKETEIIKDI